MKMIKILIIVAVVFHAFLFVYLRPVLAADPPSVPVATVAVPKEAARASCWNCVDSVEADIEKGVDEAVKSKDAGFDEAKIIGRLLLNPAYKYGYAKERMSADQIKRLKKFFSDDFIDNWIGVPSYVTLGASAMYLVRDSTVTAAAIVRIFIYPRNFYTIPHTFPTAWCDWNMRNHDAWLNRVSLNLGLTSATGTDTSTTQNFYLAGISYEINRSALLNVGWAVSTNGERGQIYCGVTLDSNFLKVLGITK